MSRLFQICLIALVALALGPMQVFGVYRNLVCQDFAQPRETSADHCHSPVATAPTASPIAIPCDNPEVETDCPPGTVSEHSEGKVKPDSFKGTTAANGGVAAPTFVPLETLVDIAAFEHLLALISGSPSSDFPYWVADDHPKHGSTSVQVAECVILLV